VPEDLDAIHFYLVMGGYIIGIEEFYNLELDRIHRFYEAMKQHQDKTKKNIDSIKKPHKK